MTLLSLTGIEAGNWINLADGETPQEGASVLVPLERLVAGASVLSVIAGSLGALVPTSTAYSELADIVDKLAFVVIEFPVFGDGRGFSLAVRLRKDFGFKGEIRATGPVTPDQALFLLRSGFDTVDIINENRIGAFETALSRYKDFYQSDYTGSTSIAHGRGAKSVQRIAS